MHRVLEYLLKTRVSAFFRVSCAIHWMLSFKKLNFENYNFLGQNFFSIYFFSFFEKIYYFKNILVYIIQTSSFQSSQLLQFLTPSIMTSFEVSNPEEVQVAHHQLICRTTRSMETLYWLETQIENVNTQNWCDDVLELHATFMAQIR